MRQNIIKKLNDTLKDKNIIVGAAVGSGFAAKYSIKGGADILLVLNAGRFRSAGIPSFAAYMPFENCNDSVMMLGSKEVIPQAKEVPVIFGVCATDPFLNLTSFLKAIKKNGFAGVNNFPTVSILDGNFRQQLEESQLGFDVEVKLIEEAAKQDLFTIGYVYNKDEAVAMAKADVDMLCINFGFTLGGYNGAKYGLNLNEAVHKAKSIFGYIDTIKPSIFKMVYGGPLTDPVVLGDFIQSTGADGYIGGSAIERIPLENSITDTMKEFKNLIQLKEENLFLKKQLARQKGLDQLVGQSESMQELYEMIMKVADTDVNVLITGESGTGKDLVSRAIHQNSNRKEKPFVKLNCASIPITLLESELFGHEKGAYTGAQFRRLGRFELANEGTLFLDEIAEMDLQLQSKILRAIEHKEFERVGGMETINVNARIISATNQDLSKAIADKGFRDDLYYRLNVLSISLPPLRERKEDIPLLVNHFLKAINLKFGFNLRSVEPIALDVIMEYNWPGNVRELEHALERAAVLGNKEKISLKHLPSYLKSNQKQFDPGDELDEVFAVPSEEDSILKEKLLQALTRHSWNITRTAGELKVSRKTLYAWMRKVNIKKYDD